MKKLIAVFALLASVCAFGAIDDTIIVIETQGPDKYADGTTVLDGERYAIVWLTNSPASRPTVRS